MSHLYCNFLTLVEKGKVVKEEWQYVPTSYCRIWSFSLTAKEKTITWKCNIIFCLADFRDALTVGQVLLSHMLWIAFWFLYKLLFIAVIHLHREELGALWIRLWIWKTPQSSSWSEIHRKNLKAESWPAKSTGRDSSSGKGVTQQGVILLNQKRIDLD